MAERVRSVAVHVDGVVLAGFAAHLVDHALGVALPGMLEGFPPEARREALRVRDAVRRAASTGTSDVGKAEVPAEVNPSESPTVTTTEAVEMAAARGAPLSARRVRQVAPRLGGRRTSAGWQIPLPEVEAWIEGRLYAQHERNPAA
jgi:hypothetical protein